MIFNSIRWRLQAWHGLILLIVLTGFGFTAYQVARDNQRRRIDQELEQRFWMTLRMPPPEPPAMEGKRHNGPPPDGGRREREHPGGRFEPEKFRERLIESIQRAASSEAGQTNSYYFVMWDCEGGMLATSSNAPPEVTAPPRDEAAPSRTETDASKTSFATPKGPGKPASFPLMRTRGEFREVYGVFPGRDSLLVGRSMAPDMAAMRRLAIWLVAAGTGILALGLAGGWWLASRAIRPVEDISATALKIAGGDLSQRINAADTESELGRLAAVLNSTFARLEASFAHQSRFTSDASHELRTPVSVILAQVQSVLSKERGGAEYREALEACQRAALRMRRLTESLLELARLDAGQQPMKREAFDLARVARDSLELVRPLAAERGLEVNCDLNPAECLGDAERIGQVATNLLSNAIHFNREHGQIRISTRSENGSAVLVVDDTGTGIPAEDLPHIFERFYRVDKSRSRVQGRTGLGLAISKAIVDAHTGVIEVSSQPERGSTFSVKLPAK